MSAASERIKQLADGLRDKISRHEDYQATFLTPSGQKVLRHLMKVSGVLGTNHSPGDPYTTAFREGQRHIVMSIFRCVNKNTEELIKQIEQGLSDE